MVISMDWLKEYIDLPGDAAFIAERLTRIGIEVERIVTLGGGFEGVVVGEIQALQRHPELERLWVARIATGNGQPHQVVTGAENISVGDRVPMAPVGARLADGRRLEMKAFKGVRSEGMICSARELGLGEEASGILVLDRQAPLGADLSQLYPRDTLLECEVPAARPDCLSHVGIARELAAATERTVRLPEMTLDPAAVGPPITGVPVDILDASLCRRYIARVVRNVRVGPSPQWLQRRLRAVGLRPINNVVDATNFVLMELGQPLHAFDLDRLSGPRIEVRPAPRGQLRTLDGEERPLLAGMLVIADAERPVALAGVIGGVDTAVTEATRNVLLESATFEGPNIRATSRVLGLRTEASIRFEKQLSPALAHAGAERACRLLQQVTGGEVGEGSVDAYPRPFVPRAVVLEEARLHRILGSEVTLGEGGEILKRLEFTVRLDAHRLEAEAPAVRLDINIPEDLVEEIGRIRGYDRIRGTLPGRRTPVRDFYVAQDFEEQVKAFLTGAGFDEVMTYPFTARRATLDIGIPGHRQRMLEIVKPVSADWDALRTSLLPGLLRTAVLNARVDVLDLSIFEVSRVFWPREEAGKQPEEPSLLALVETVPAGDGGSSKAALRHLKGVLERLRFDLARQAITFEAAACPGFHPARCALVREGQETLGVMGEVSPEVLERAGLSGRAVAAEVELRRFAGDATAQPQAVPVSRFPAVVRDLAVIVAATTPSADLTQVMRQGGGYTLTEVQVLDEYEGPQVGSGRKSLHFRLTFQARDRTLTHEEVRAALTQIDARLKARGGEIRGTI